MSLSHTFVFVSRSDLLDTLQKLHDEPPASSGTDAPSPGAVRARIDRLLLELDPDVHRPRLRAALLDPAADPAIRRSALDELARRRVALPAGDLAVLLDEDREARRASGPVLDLARVLELARTRDAIGVAAAHLHRIGSRDRVELLVEIDGRDPEEIAAELRDLLYRRFHYEDRAALAREGWVPSGAWQTFTLEHAVASATRHRRASRLALLEAWATAEGPTRRDLLDAVAGFPELPGFVVHRPDLLHEAADALVLPVHVLVEVLGPARLGHLVSSRIAALIPPRALPFDAFRPSGAANEAAWRALDVLARLPDGPRRAIALLGRLDDDALQASWLPWLAGSLIEPLWARDRAATVALAQTALVRGYDKLAIAVLDRVAGAPRDEDRGLLRLAVAEHHDLGVIRLGVAGILALDGLHAACAAARAFDDPLLEPYRVASRVRAGEEDAVLVLGDLLVGPYARPMRAAALRCIEALGPGRWLDALDRALSTDLGCGCGACTRLAAQAAEVLAGIGSPEAIATLLSAYVALPARAESLADTIGAAIASAVRRQDR